MRAWMLAPSLTACAALQPPSPVVLGAVPGFGRLVEVPAGAFQMGSPADEPGRFDDESLVAVEFTRGLRVMESEVTQGMWRAVTGEDPVATLNRRLDGVEHGPCATYEGRSLVGDDLPVSCVSWFDAIRFANFASAREGLKPAYIVIDEQVTWDRAADGYRLPTEAEWEYFARAGGRTVYAGAAAASEVCVLGNVRDAAAAAAFGSDEEFPCDDGFAALSPVKHFRPNAWGIYDTTGGVWEWTWDWYADPSQGGLDPAGPATGETRVCRGGSWSNAPLTARLALRNENAPTNRNAYLGLRLVRSGG
jgi:formylglycine-generating enzyme required for sulfatase activity